MVKQNGFVRVTAKVDYAVRAAMVLGRAALAGEGPVKGERIATEQGISVRFLENILGELRAAGIVRSQRGAEGGYSLQRDPHDISMADIVRALEGPLANVRGERPDDLDYPEGAEVLREAWLAMRAASRSVLETVTVADLATGTLPPPVAALLEDPEAWAPH